MSVSPYINNFVTVLSAPVTTGITVFFMLQIFFSSLARFRYLYFFSLSFSFTQWPTGTAKFPIQQILFFLLTINRSGRLAEIRWSVCISKSQRSLCFWFSMADSRSCVYHLFGWSNFCTIRSVWPFSPRHVYYYTFCASLLHSLIM